MTKKPVIMKLSPGCGGYRSVARACQEAGADGQQPYQYSAGDADRSERRRPLLANGTGGMSGPGIFPLAVRMVHQVYEAVDIPIVGMGGVSTAEDVLELMLAGATAVDVGAANLVEPCACRKIPHTGPACRHGAVRHSAATDIIGGAHHG